MYGDFFPLNFLNKKLWKKKNDALLIKKVKGIKNLGGEKEKNEKNEQKR
jgi:hypothetical protein